MARRYLYLIVALVLLCAGGVFWYSISSEPVLHEDTSLLQGRGATEELSYVEGVYDLDLERSSLRWAGTHIAGGGYDGFIDMSGGAISYEDGIISAEPFVIDMASMRDSRDTPRLVEHLVNEDFFDVERYPASILEISSFDPASDADEYDYRVSADLTILNVTQEISFPARVETTSNGGRITASFDIDRTRWGIIYGSGSFFDDLGDRAISDTISFDVDLYYIRNVE